MTDKQIKQNAEEYAKKIYPYTVGKAAAIRDFIAGAHSRDEEIKELKEEIESLKENEKELFEGFKKRGTKLGELMKENVKLRNPWISVEDRLPEKSRGLYKLEENEQHKHVLFRTRNGLTFSGYLDAEEIWRDERTIPVNYITPSPVTYWMPIPELKN